MVNFLLDLIFGQFSLAPDPRLWGADLSPYLVEPDDELHNPDLDPDKTDVAKKIVTTRAITNLGCLLVLLSALILLLWVQMSISLKRFTN